MNKVIWKVIPLVLTILLPVRIFAQSCNGDDPCTQKTGQDQVDCYVSLTNACANQRNTLASQISYMDSQIKLTTLRITATQAKISTLTDEIDKLETEVTRLEGILNDRLALLLKRIPASYKRASTSDFGVLLFSKNIFDFITRIKYVQTVQAEDAALVFQVKATQNSYNDSKKVREDKKSQLEEIKTELNQQNLQLASQKAEKDALLTATQGNEARYEQLLAAARAQLAAINNFVSNLGGAGILSNQTSHSDWGTYYNQRDSAWASHGIGSSSESIANVGCLVTSLAMVMTHYGRSVTPIDVASTLDLFFTGTAYMYQGTHNIAGASVTRTPTSTGTIDGELAAGHPVIVGVYNGPAHFVVLKSGSGGNYTMNDPFVESGHDIAFTSHYSMGAITEVDTVRVN